MRYLSLYTQLSSVYQENLIDIKDNRLNKKQLSIYTKCVLDNCHIVKTKTEHHNLREGCSVVFDSITVVFASVGVTNVEQTERI